MTRAVSRHTALLAALPGMSPSAGLARARLDGEAQEVLIAACDDAEKSVIVDLPRALRSLRALVSVADEAGPSPARARTRRGLAQALAYANQFDDALVALREAVTLAESTGDTLEAARSRMTTLHALARLGRFPEAMAAGEHALRDFSSAGEALLAARAEINLGVTCRMSDEPRLALGHFDRALPALGQEPVLRAQLESNRAEALLDLNDFQNAEAAFESALTSFNSAQLSRAAAIVEGNIADLQSRQGRVQDALLHFERARRQLGGLDALGDVARLGVEKAEALLSVGLASDAIGTIEAALPVLREHKMTAELARGLVALARAKIELSLPREAGPLLLEAQGLFVDLKHVTGTARVAILESQVAAGSGEIASARLSLHRAVEMLAGRPAEQATARARLASLELRSGHVEEAERELELSLSVACALDLAPLRSHLLHLRALCHRAGQRWFPAVQDLRAAIGQVERIRGTLRSDRLRAAFLGDRISLYDDAIRTTLDAARPGALDDAFRLVESSKGRSLLDQMQSAVASATRASEAARDDPETALIRTSSRLRSELHALHEQVDGLSTHRARRPDHAWNCAVRDREQKLREVELRLASTARFGLVFSEPTSLEAARSMLPPTAAVVEYFEEDGWISAFVITSRETSVCRRLVRRDDAEELVQSLYFQINRAIVRGLPSGPVGDRLTADTTRELANLGSTLLAPVWGDLRGVERLIVVPQGVLHRVPFHALVIGGEYVLDHVEISIAPSVSVLAAMKSRRVRGSDALVVGVSDDRIPQAEVEARRVGEALAGSTVLLGAKATIAGVLGCVAGRDILHLAAHARFIPRDPEASGIKLADGWLSAHDISALRLEGTEVVLSGCDTGRAALDAGDELMGLARAFLLAGSSSLILSLWTLHDQTASEIMASLYRLWYSSSDEPRTHVARGLRQAQVEIRSRHPHPAAWAPMAAITPI